MDEDAERTDEDDAERRFPHNWHAYLIADEREAVVRIPGRLLERIYRQADGTLQHHVERALELYADKLDTDAESFIPGSQAAPIQRWRPPVVADPASADEKRTLVRRLRQIR